MARTDCLPRATACPRSGRSMAAAVSWPLIRAPGPDGHERPQVADKRLRYRRLITVVPSQCTDMARPTIGRRSQVQIAHRRGRFCLACSPTAASERRAGIGSERVAGFIEIRARRWPAARRAATGTWSRSAVNRFGRLPRWAARQRGQPGRQSGRFGPPVQCLNAAIQIAQRDRVRRPFIAES